MLTYLLTFVVPTNKPKPQEQGQELKTFYSKDTPLDGEPCEIVNPDVSETTYVTNDHVDPIHTQGIHQRKAWVWVNIGTDSIYKSG
jgi:hypothetical protein